MKYRLRGGGIHERELQDRLGSNRTIYISLIRFQNGKAGCFRGASVHPKKGPAFFGRKNRVRLAKSLILIELYR